MKSQTVKIAAIPILAVAMVFVVYQQYFASEAEQVTELAIQAPQRSTPGALAEKKSTTIGVAASKKVSLESLGAFNPFARSPQIDSLYQQPVAVITQSISEKTEPIGETKLVARPAVETELLADDLEATFEGPNGWVAMINSRTYLVGDAIVNQNGEPLGVVIQIRSGYVLISRRNPNIQ